MEKLVDRTSNFLDFYIFSKYPHLINAAAKYFFFTSKITHFFLFRKLGIILYWVFYVYVFLSNGNNFTYVYYATLHKGWLTFGSNLIEYLDWNFFLLLGFVGLLSELAFNNTVLVSIPAVNNKIKSLYGNDFPSRVGYNSRFNTIARTGEKVITMAIGLSAAALGATYGQIHETNAYERNYATYVNTQVANPNINIQAPVRGSLLKFPFIK